jgi:transglutaminase-like putative cysteine protease
MPPERFERAMIFSTHHKTRYKYPSEVSLSHNLVHLTPRASASQNCLSHALRVSVPTSVITSQADCFGNPVEYFTIQQSHRELVVSASNVVELQPISAPDPDQTLPWEQVRNFLQTDHRPQTIDAYQFAFASPLIKRDSRFSAYAAKSFPPGRRLLAGVIDLAGRIHGDFRYDSTATTITTPLSEVFALCRGVCQDFAHLAIGCLRSLGLAARYVSGYLLTDPPPGQERLRGADASHAWVSVYCPASGWIDVDPTNNLIPSDKHITLAWGRDYDDVSPIKGVILGGGRHAPTVSVDVVATG